MSQHLENDFVMYSPVVLWKRQTVDVDHTGLKIATWIKLMQGFDCLQRDGRIKVGSKRKFYFNTKGVHVDIKAAEAQGG